MKLDPNQHPIDFFFFFGPDDIAGGGACTDDCTAAPEKKPAIWFWRCMNATSVNA